MRKVLVIAAREYKAAVKTKSFIIGILLMPLMLGGSTLALLFMDQIDTRTKKFAIVDRTPDQRLYAVLKEKAEKANKEGAAPGKRAKAPTELENVSLTPEADLVAVHLALSDRVRHGDLTGFLEIGPEIFTPAPPPAPVKASDMDALAAQIAANSAKQEAHGLRYQTNRPAYEDFSKWATEVINEYVRQRRAADHKISPDELKSIYAPVERFTKGLTKRNPQTGAIEEGAEQNVLVATLLPFGLLMLMFMMVLVGAAPLLHGVIEEKMQRIAEVLLGSVQPFPLMMGKITGMTLVSLTMTAIYLGGTYWAIWSYGYSDYLSAEVIFWFLLYQVMALFMFGSIYAAVGAACADLKEAQTMLMPVSLVSMIPLFIWINVVREPTSTFATGVSFFPLFTPMLMIARVAVPPGIPWWQPALGVVVVLAFTLLCVYVAGRIFRVGILLQGKGARFGDLWRWVLKG